MFAHKVMSWTVEQLSCIFSMTIAGCPVLDLAFIKLYIPHLQKFCMPTCSDGQNNSKTTCICLYRVQFPTWIGIPGFIYFGENFSAVNIRQTSYTMCWDSPRLWFTWCRSWHCSCLDWFSRPLLYHAMESCGGIGEETSVCQETPQSITWFDFTLAGQCGIFKIFFTFDFHILPLQETHRC